MRLTLDLILQAPQTINAAGHRMISIRGYKIASIENLGATRDQFDCIDLSDNEIIKVNNMPPMNRLEMLILANNRISRFDPDLAEQIPNLTSIILTNNKIERLVDLEPLCKAKKLTRLSLHDNPVQLQKYYRAFLIYRIPSLRFIDFCKVKAADRLAAQKIFEGPEGLKLLQQLAPSRAAPSQSTETKTTSNSAHTTSSAEIEKIKSAIAKATTMEEINLLEKALRSNTLMSEQSDSLSSAG